MHLLVRSRSVVTVIAVLCALAGVVGYRFFADPSPSAPRSAWHYAANGNFSGNTYAAGKAGFNLADVSSKSELAALPQGVRALFYLDACSGVDAKFVRIVSSLAHEPALFGYYLVDEPMPTRCSPVMLRAESDYIHAHQPGQRTFIVVQNLASSTAPSFAGGYNTANTHIDLFGIAPYPCRSELHGCDFDMVSRYVAAAQNFGISRSAIVPVFQAFGGGTWVDDGGGTYLLPTAGQARRLLSEWRRLVPNPAFDFVYSWGVQRSDQTLEVAPAALQHVFAAHNG
jgi:hypothetical protein